MKNFVKRATLPIALSTVTSSVTLALGTSGLLVRFMCLQTDNRTGLVLELLFGTLSAWLFRKGEPVGVLRQRCIATASTRMFQLS